MRKQFFIFFILFFAVLAIQVNTAQVNAASVALTKIGNLDTTGKAYTHWYYSDLKPALKGTADPQVAVIVTVDGADNTVNSDSSGNWSYTPNVELSAGDHTIKIASGSSNYAFTLTTGSSGAPTATPSDQPTATLSASTLPVTGDLLPITMLFATGGILMFLGFRLKDRVSV